MGDPGQQPLIDLTAAGGAPEAGGKGAALAALARAGLPVPPARVLRVRVLDDALVRAGLADVARQVEDELARDGDGAARAARCLRSSVLGTPLPDQVVRAVSGLLETLRAWDDRAALAVRSSATCEGVPGASFAGQFQTFLDIRTTDEASAAIRSCWASLWSAPALGYRASGAAVGMPGMAVLLQGFVPAVAAGGARVDDEGVVVEAAWGLGLTVMSGLVVPDRFRFGLDGRPRGAELGCKPVRAAACDGTLVWEPVPPERREVMSLDEAAAAEVARLALRAAVHLGAPLEMEWALAESGRTVWVLQGRRSERGPRPAAESGKGAEPAGDEVLRGIPVAPGVVLGPARMVERPDDFDDVGPRDVAVARYAAASMMHRFRGGGLVTEMGGASAHAATIARERRFPMVAGVLGATRRLGEGQLVRLDGGTGLVEVLTASREELPRVSSFAGMSMTLPPDLDMTAPPNPVSAAERGLGGGVSRRDGAPKDHGELPSG